jgi:MerR family transcriptional regulator, copper efflux regulator
MRIGEIAALSKVSKDTVRLYTRRGLIHCSLKKAGSKQYADYAEGTIELIKGVKMMQSVGFTLAEIKPLADEYANGNPTSDRSRTILTTKLQEIEEKQHRLVELATALRHKLDNPHPKSRRM